MKILVCGSRDWTNSTYIAEAMSSYPKDSIVIHGGCRGADSLAAAFAIGYGMKVVEYRAD